MSDNLDLEITPPPSPSPMDGRSDGELKLFYYTTVI